VDRSQEKIKGRGAADSPPGRFETLARNRELETEVKSKPETVVTLQRARSIIARNDSPDLPFTQSINPYQGCEQRLHLLLRAPEPRLPRTFPRVWTSRHGSSRRKMPRAAAKGIVRPDYRCELIALGANTDPYQPVRTNAQDSRENILEVLGSSVIRWASSPRAR